MSRRLIIRPEAEADIIEAAVWYEAREHGLGLAFTSEIHAAIERSLQPHFSLCTSAKPRTFVVSLCGDFPTASSIIVRADAIVVFTVLHAAQHERHWEQRMEELR